MSRGFEPISLKEYVKIFLAANPGDVRADVEARLRDAMDAYTNGERCSCGEPIWIIGSAEVGLGCFTCITGEAKPDNDYEIAIE